MNLTRELIEAIEDSSFKSKDEKKQILCSSLLNLAKVHEINSKHIGEYCSVNNIKIISCQLGCF